ncbi:ubiquitin-conjugating enzyme E2 C isoform X2 [Danio rerio]|uniref:Deoxynucleotidyltransferase terminal-interacting protein 1 n=1 Tax=Danio rerio TaxID=7955 RepID=A0A8M1RK84_DANRE|nr:deoxynucleotidyltransferase terminal-interacting protein 1 [Danio rerio]|eukprot:XP_002662598.5 deoxynucleotidyltransferase terminal-interacting protein 1 [Danio rerio]
MGAHTSEGRRDWLQQDFGEQQVQTVNPWNIMIKHRQVHRRGRRSQMAVSYTDPIISMDLLRTVLQPSFNEDIRAVFRKYMKFFEKAASNVKENVGGDTQPDQLIRDACRNCLEHAKQLFPEAEKTAPKPIVDPTVKRARQPDDTSGQRDSPVPKKRKGRPPGSGSQYASAQYSTPAKLKVTEPIKREGPKWDPSRLNESSTFVLGSRANKALGMGGTRGRIYIKHAELFKYAADAQDKHWLSERQHMRATGGKMAYLLIEEDILDLARSDDYKDSPELKMDELKPFSVPIWMVEKMQKAMEVQKSENELAV